MGRAFRIVDEFAYLNSQPSTDQAQEQVCASVRQAREDFTVAKERYRFETEGRKRCKSTENPTVRNTRADGWTRNRSSIEAMRTPITKHAKTFTTSVPKGTSIRFSSRRILAANIAQQFLGLQTRRRK